MDIVVSFPGGKRVDAAVGPFTVRTDLPSELGGEGSAAAPFDLFLASVATCTGLHVLAFCHARALSTEGISLTQHVDTFCDTKLLRAIHQVLHLPASFPAQHRGAIVRAAEACRVMRTIAAGPQLQVTTTVDAAAA